MVFLVALGQIISPPSAQAAVETIYDGTNTGLNGDDNYASAPIGFSFNFYGNNYPTAYVNINGMLAFGNGYAEYTEQPIPSDEAPNNFIAAFWDDLITNIGTGTSRPSIYYKTIGSAPNRTFITQWTNMYFYNTTVQMGTFQIYLYEGSNEIQIQYRNLLGSGRSNGNSAAIGLENSDGTEGIQHSFQTASVIEKQAIRFTPSDGSYSVNANATYLYNFLRDADNPAPDVPTLASPADAAANQGVLPTFSWNAAANATSYKLIVAANADFSGVEVNQAGITGTSYTLQTPLLQKSHTYYWRIEAINGNGTALSDARSFSTEPNVVPSTPDAELLGPLNKVDGTLSGATQPALTFSLADDDNDALRYQIQIDDSADFSSPVISYTSGTGGQGARGFTVGQAVGSGSYATGSQGQGLASGSYYWRVRALDNYGGASSYATANSGAIAFRVDATAPTGLTVPASTTPTADATPTWTWSAATDANGLQDPAYHIEWSQSASFSGGVQSTTSNATSFTPSSPLADGTWYVRVRVTDSFGNATAYATAAAVVIDTTAPSSPGTPAATSPTANAKPAFTWTASTDAGSGLGAPAYAVEWSLDPAFANGVFSATSATASYAPATNLSDGRWYFRVKAVDAAGNASAFSSAGSVLIDTAAPTFTGSINASTPTNQSAPTWTWTAFIDVGSGLAATPYTIQWSQDPSFANEVFSATAATASYSHPTPLAEGTWYFRVKATDALGMVSAFTEALAILIDRTAPTPSGAPVVTTPVGDATPSWTWEAGTDAGSGIASYVIEWSRDPNFADGLASATTASAAYTHGAALADGTWYVRVTTVDAAGNTAVSAVTSTFIDATAPTVPSMPVATKNPSKSTSPTWKINTSTDEGSGLAAAPYRLQWSRSKDFSGTVIEGTATAAEFILPSALADGTWYVRVAAVDAAGNVSAYSSAGSVVIDTAPDLPAVTVETPPAEAAPTQPVARPVEPATYDVTIRVVDQHGNPVPGARVEIHSDVMVAYSDAEGYARFTAVPNGDHHVEVYYRDQQVTTDLTVGPDSSKAYAAAPGEPLNLTVQLEAPVDEAAAWNGWLIAFLLGALAATFGLWLVGKRRRKEEEPEENA